VTIGRNVPLDEAGWRMENIISDFQQQNYFAPRPLKSPKRFGAAGEISFFAQANSANDQGVDTSRKTKIARVICPSSGKSVGRRRNDEL
jgi:hypothetical protein